MMQSLWAVVHDGKIELSEAVQLSEGTKVLVTLLPEDEDRFWLGASQKSLAAIWDNVEDDAYPPVIGNRWSNRCVSGWNSKIP